MPQGVYKNRPLSEPAAQATLKAVPELAQEKGSPLSTLVKTTIAAPERVVNLVLENTS